MAGNHLESLVAEWYELRGYFIRRNVQVGKLPKGGYECELDVVGFHPEQRSLVQIESSLDADGWAVRESGTRRNLMRAASTFLGCFEAWRFPRTSI